MEKEVYKQKMRDISFMEHGPEQLELILLLEDVVEKMDDFYEMFDYKFNVVYMAIFSGDIDIAFANFSWMLSNLPDDITIVHTSKVIPCFKWIINNAISIPYISIKQIEGLLEEMLGFLKKSDISLEPYFKLIFALKLYNFDNDGIEDIYEKWNRQARSIWFSDCKACNQAERVRYLILTEQYDLIEEYMRPIEEGELVCGEVPHFVYPLLSVEYIINGDLLNAKKYHALGAEMIVDNKKNLEPISQMILSSCILNLNDATKYIEYYHYLITDSKLPIANLTFHVALCIYFKKQVKLGNIQLTIKLPKDFQKYSQSNRYECEKMYEYHLSKAQSIMEMFDTRNENDNISTYYNRQISYFSVFEMDVS